MTALYKVRVQVGDAVVDLIKRLEGYFVVAQALLAHIRRIADDGIEAAVGLALLIVEEDFGEL